jgi:hypothetical protein
MAHEGEDAAPTADGTRQCTAARRISVRRVGAIQPAAEAVWLYVSDWRAFVSWCKTARRLPLPADPDTIAAYLASPADTLSYGTRRRFR